MRQAFTSLSPNVELVTQGPTVSTTDRLVQCGQRVFCSRPRVEHTESAAVLWTGGKDSAMALYEAEQQGFHVACLATFAPPEPQFLAHPIAFIEHQALALQLPHFVISVKPPMKQSYEAGLCWLRDEIHVNTVVTGDIAAVAGYPNWIRDRSRAVGIEVYTPLWARDRDTLLQQLLERGFKTYISCVKTSCLNARWVGRRLDPRAVSELTEIRSRTGLDLCGEQGEYHTVVTDGPPFVQQINIRSYSKRTAGAYAYMAFQYLAIVDHAVV